MSEKKDPEPTAKAESGNISREMLDAGIIPPGPERFVVTHTHSHKTLRSGDVVVVSEVDGFRNVLIRISDATTHGLIGHHNQYVHLERSN